jgi:galactose-1-phosphate uridylyltransferase
LLARRDELAPEALISAGVQAQDRVNDVLKEEVGQVFARVLRIAASSKKARRAQQRLMPS